MKQLYNVCWYAVAALAGCNVSNGRELHPTKCPEGETESLYVSSIEVVAGVRSWAEQNTEISGSVAMFASDETLWAQILPVRFFGGHARDACRGLNSCSPALEYWGTAESCVTIADIPETFVALRLSGDFKMRTSFSNGRLRFFEWDAGFVRDSSVVTDIAELFPSLRYLDVMLYAPSLNANSITNEVIDLASLARMKSLERVKLSFGSLVTNAGALLEAGRSLEASVDAGVLNEDILHEYYTSRGWWNENGECTDRQLAKKLYKNACPGQAVHADLVDGFECLAIDGLHDFTGSAPSASVQVLEIVCKSAEQESFQRMCEGLMLLLPNIEWVVIESSFSERSSLDLAFLRNCEKLVFVGVEVENGVVLNMEGCREKTKFAGCEISFSLAPDVGDRVREGRDRPECR